MLQECAQFYKDCFARRIIEQKLEAHLKESEMIKHFIRLNISTTLKQYCFNVKQYCFNVFRDSDTTNEIEN